MLGTSPLQNVKTYIQLYFDTPNGKRQLSKRDTRDPKTNQLIRKDSSMALALQKAVS